MVLPASFNCQGTTTVTLKVGIIECSRIYTDCCTWQASLFNSPPAHSMASVIWNFSCDAYKLCLKLTIYCRAALHTTFETTGTSTSRSLSDIGPPNEVVPQPMKWLISFYSDSNLLTINQGPLSFKVIWCLSNARGSIYIQINIFRKFEKSNVIDKGKFRIVWVDDDLGDINTLPLNLGLWWIIFVMFAEEYNDISRCVW